MFRFRGREIYGSVGHVSVPPIAVRAIEESDNIAQLIPAAINLRDRYKGLREWLGRYQDAIDIENEKDQLTHEKLLLDLAQSLKVTYGADKSGETGVSISTAFFNLDIPQSLLDKVRNSFGVRSTLCKLLMAPRGQQALKKLLSMLGEGKSLLGSNVLQELRSRYATEEPTGTQS
jgi:hypothetical protein